MHMIGVNRRQDLVPADDVMMELYACRLQKMELRLAGLQWRVAEVTWWPVADGPWWAWLRAAALIDYHTGKFAVDDVHIFIVVQHRYGGDFLR